MTIASHDDAMFNAAGGELSEDTMVINNPLVDAEQMPNNPSGKQSLSRRTRIALWSSGAVLAVLLLSLLSVGSSVRVGITKTRLL